MKRERYIANYNALVDEMERNAEDGDGEEDPGLGPYHYGSHYSNTGVVLHFLVRLPPFTAMFLGYQGLHHPVTYEINNIDERMPMRISR